MTTSERGAILLVDDERHVSEMLREFFSELGYSVGVATTGEDALRHVRHRRPDAVLLDMRLPDTTGERLLARLRVVDGTLAIVMLTGDVDDDLPRRAAEAGALACLRKPFDFDELERTMARAVACGRLAAPVA
jgi:DNA-binding response OmpR family regulator